jgi:hypothetical protein
LDAGNGIGLLRHACGLGAAGGVEGFHWVCHDNRAVVLVSDGTKRGRLRMESLAGELKWLPIDSGIYQEEPREPGIGC